MNQHNYCHCWEQTPISYSTGILPYNWRQDANYLNVISKFQPKCLFCFLNILMLLWSEKLKVAEFAVMFHKVFQGNYVLCTFPFFLSLSFVLSFNLICIFGITNNCRRSFEFSQIKNFVYDIE